MEKRKGGSSERSNEQRGLDEFYDLSIESGEVRNRRSRKRSFVLPTSSWAALRTALQSAFREGAPALMRQIGYIVGASFAGELREAGGSPAKIASILPDAGRVSGWGAITFAGETEGWSNVTATVANCPVCEFETSSTPPLCDLLVGVLNGLADGVFEKPHMVTETRCGYGTDRRCEFVVSEVPEEPDDTKHWASYVLFPWLQRKRG